ncbi:MAG: hypothetical protein ACREH5_05240 [Candidatus Omnitrophota bacterium]
MKTLRLAGLIVLFLILSGSSDLRAYIVQEGVSKDLDRDGYRESIVFYNGKLIQKVLMDADHDGKMESVIFYKNGYRDRAERDTDLDGRIDFWVSYYFTGAPWKIAKDRNRDGAPDTWEYIKEGAVYKWELDRNFDGRADVRIAYDLPHLATAKAAGKEILKQLHDNDFDGVFEDVFISAEGHPRMSLSLSEVLIGV